MNMRPCESCAAPLITVWATLIAVGSLTAREPVRVACGQISLLPVQLWQLMQAAAKIILPRISKSGDGPRRCEAGATGASVGGRSDEFAAGTERRYAAIA